MLLGMAKDRRVPAGPLLNTARGCCLGHRQAMGARAGGLQAVRRGSELRSPCLLCY